MTASITIEIAPGASIESACVDAQRVADLLGIDCQFQFNGVRCLAVPHGLSQVLAEAQQAEQARRLAGPFDRKFAISDPRRGTPLCKAPVT